MRAIVRTRIAKGLLIAFSTLTTILVASIVVLSIMQTIEKPIEGYDGSLCQDSELNEYRPFKLSVIPKVPASNQTTYKLCMKMRIGSTHANGTVLCVQPKAPKINDGRDYDLSAMSITCAWDGLRNSARRLGITIGCLFLPIFLIIWLVFEAKWVGKIFGLIYMLFALASAVGFSWMMILDADSVRKSMDFCKATYVDGTMCNPVEYPHSVREDCSCDEIQFITVVLLDVAGIVIWIFVFACCLFRCWAYRYSDDEILATATEEETAPVVQNDDRERHAAQIANSYGYKSEERQSLVKNY